MTTEIQEFIQEQLTKTDGKTDEPLILAGCLAAQVRHLYVALCGEETTLQVYRTMLEGLRQDVLIIPWPIIPRTWVQNYFVEGKYSCK